ncbi:MULTISPECIES: type II CRISPR RNA-guided endonuclease Cas9 [unclassified Polaribacter]|uniref:type II CRISPR RNA-guided endonuclease Cas9 n=1 Tax=unclassified Polaribacter TaxID=196858 RepID=UPI0011BECE25|nr:MULTISPECIES: type II CRISPR RNA-guided endonuclease Cas9 [unclassified Polaribacter]TXD54357.1 type II CRISPR RNA-guided endonuclease Cas9 [Polaribacter sp. IC063]TXD62812.1 type II CRISPR RNA-guided endonuclease Cas9 [Polaribacter sp. IC066]
MKNILGLDLGTTSIGWALVNEAETKIEKSEIIKLGVRIIQYDNFSKVDKSGKVSESKNPESDFLAGKGLSPNAGRTLKRGARRNLQRFKLRRTNLIEILIKNKIISKSTALTEVGESTTHQTLNLRAKSAKEKIELTEFARVLLAINKKRGYKSSRKANSEEEGNSIDGMKIAKELYDNNLTVGQYVSNLLESGKKFIPDFYRSDLQQEFNLVWNFQKQFYIDVLDDEFYKIIEGQGQQTSRKVFLKYKGIYTAENKGKREEVKKQHYLWRSEAISKQLKIEEVAYVLVEINNNLNQSSGYLGAISDRSKELYFNKETVGENLYNQIKENKHTSLRNQVFYRQDYLDEFEQIWETQVKFHSELTLELKKEIRDIVIFYQRKLKSQKHLISDCQFERYHKAIPKSSPLFQEFKIWSILNNLEFENIETKEKKILGEEIKQDLFEKLNGSKKLTEKEILKFVDLSDKLWKTNFSEGVEGNKTNEKIYEVYKTIAENEGYGFDWDKKSSKEIENELKAIFKMVRIKESILDFNSDLEGNDFDKQDSYQFWHLLYSAQDDDKISEVDKITYGNSNVALKKKLHQKYGFKPDFGNLLANVPLQQDYGKLSAKAIKKILPYLKSGQEYSEASRLAGYNHSNSLTKEELENRVLKDNLELLPKNSLRNPVVEKILNQMVNVINGIIAEYGKPKEIRIELARDLKKSAKERADTTQYINKATLENEAVRKVLQDEFRIKNPTRNDVIKYKLYQELKNNGYRTLFTNTYIPTEKLFSKEIDIEHIIPKAKLFDDSFSNKTLAYRKVNLEKADTLAFDFIDNKYNSDLENYKLRVESTFKSGAITKGKYKKLLLSEKNLPDGFIDRDLRNSQYIAKKAKQILEEVFEKVTPTIGNITDKLREDWDLINVMKELNLSKYRELGLTEWEERKYDQKVEKIIDWTKRNDHRHHAMDALTVAFTTHNHIQYLNNLGAINSSFKNKRDLDKSYLFGIKQKITKVYKDKQGRGKRKFIPPSENFRSEAKDQIGDILISFKAKNKVVTNNKNKIKVAGKDNYIIKTQLTPRGQLHKETVYGRSKDEIIKIEKINANFDLQKINEVTKPKYKEALLKRFQEFENDGKKAFAGKNALSKNPLYTIEGKLVPIEIKTRTFEDSYTIRKEVNPDNFKNLKSLQKVIDVGIRRILEERLAQYNGKPKEAFSDLIKNPIWLHKQKGISIKRVAISGVKNAENLHVKKNHFGDDHLDETNKKVKNDFVSTGNNHHMAIYIDEKGKLHDNVVSFYKAVARMNSGLPAIDKELNANNGWEFLFTMKQNEMFLIPSEGFNPLESDLSDKSNLKIISKNLFRVQKFSKVDYGNSSIRDYVFRHHLETELIDKKETKNITYKVFKSIGDFDQILKVRINHIGKIVHVGEY